MQTNMIMTKLKVLLVDDDLTFKMYVEELLKQKTDSDVYFFEVDKVCNMEDCLTSMKENDYDLVVLNFANMDMVGHTGIIEAAVKACETIDKCVNKVVSYFIEQGGVVLLTADHGNAEQMIDENGKPHTAHSLNPVPLVLIDDTRKDAELKSGSLKDIAPTILHIMGIEKPELMDGVSLVET